MTENLNRSVTVCSATFGVGQGYILPSFLKALSVKSRPSFIITKNLLYSVNVTPDTKFLHRSYIYGDEINLKWDNSIPEEDRFACLSFDLRELSKKITRILKKDQASLFIVHNRTVANATLFKEEEASNQFTIYVGRGTNDREGLQSVPATRIRYQESIVQEPSEILKLSIPVKTFHEMMKSFSKCKPDEKIKITFYETPNGNGFLISGSSELNTGTIIEKYGIIPDDVEPESESALSRVSGKTFLIINLPNEFIIDKDKVSYFINFSNLSNEGTIRIYYTEGKDLKFAFRFGPYGEQTIYINS